MSIITSISIKNEDFEYIKKNCLSPTALFNIGLARKKHLSVIPEDSDGLPIDIPDKLNKLEEKNKALIQAIQILTERAEKAENMLEQYMEKRGMI